MAEIISQDVYIRLTAKDGTITVDQRWVHGGEDGKIRFFSQIIADHNKDGTKVSVITRDEYLAARKAERERRDQAHA